MKSNLRVLELVEFRLAYVNGWDREHSDERSSTFDVLGIVGQERGIELRGTYDGMILFVPVANWDAFVSLVKSWEQTDKEFC